MRSHPGFNIFAAFICLLLFASSFRIDNGAGTWKLLKSKDNISSFSGKAGAGGIIPTKVEMTVHASPERVVQVIADMNSYKAWVPYCITSFLVQKIADTVYYGYQRVSAPLVKDRDLAIRCSIRKTGDRAYEIDIVAVPNLVKLESKAIRITHLATHYQVYADQQGTTHVLQVSEVDVGGSIPMFLLNWLNKYQPWETCQSLRKVMES